MAKYRRLSPIVDELRRERVKKGLAQWEVAMDAGYCRESLAAWEAGLRMPSLTATEDWAKTLGLKIQIGTQL